MWSTEVSCHFQIYWPVEKLSSIDSVGLGQIWNFFFFKKRCVKKHISEIDLWIHGLWYKLISAPSWSRHQYMLYLKSLCFFVCLKSSVRGPSLTVLISLIKWKGPDSKTVQIKLFWVKELDTVLCFALKLGLSTPELLLCPLCLWKTLETYLCTDHRREESHQRRLSEKSSYIPFLNLFPSSINSRIQSINLSCSWIHSSWGEAENSSWMLEEHYPLILCT